MIDIISSLNGQDLGVFDTQTMKASNILSVQLGNLEYAQNLGIDLNYFLSSDFQFQNASFKAYLIQILANNSINVASVVDVVDRLFHTYNFQISASDKSGLIAR